MSISTSNAIRMFGDLDRIVGAQISVGLPGAVTFPTRKCRRHGHVSSRGEPSASRSRSRGGYLDLQILRCPEVYWMPGIKSNQE